MRKRKEITTKKFENDFDEIFEYLQEKSPQSSIKFAQEFDERLDEIKKQPKSCSPEPYLPTK